VKDVDFDRHQIVVRRGKGQKDRRTMLPVAVREPLQTHLTEVKRQHERDLAQGAGGTMLPFALDRKYPNASTDWAWQFVFPRHGFVAIRVGDRRRGITFTRQSSRERWPTPHGRLVW
jgi:integrase